MLTDCRESEELQSSPQGQQTDFFPLNYVLFIWQQHMATASPQIPLIYYCETETKTLELSTPGNPVSCSSTGNIPGAGAVSTQRSILGNPTQNNKSLNFNH